MNRPHRPYFAELAPWPIPGSHTNKAGIRRVVDRPRAMWETALAGHLRACHNGVLDPKCAGCRDLTQKIEASI
jgi:hypothetical protein